jgi:hypothetical protein
MTGRRWSFISDSTTPIVVINYHQMNRIIAIILILITGLLNFHIPHFLTESNHLTGVSNAIEVTYLINLLAVLAAAVGLYCDQHWGWTLGVLVALFSAFLWLLQKTVGLPGLPRTWLEPSRIVSLIIEGLFLLYAYRYFRTRRSMCCGEKARGAKEF